MSKLVPPISTIFFHNFGNSYARVSGRVSSCSLSPQAQSLLVCFLILRKGKSPQGLEYTSTILETICSVEESSAQNIQPLFSNVVAIILQSFLGHFQNDLFPFETCVEFILQDCHEHPSFRNLVYVIFQYFPLCFLLDFFASFQQIQPQILAPYALDLLVSLFLWVACIVLICSCCSIDFCMGNCVLPFVVILLLFIVYALYFLVALPS